MRTRIYHKPELEIVDIQLGERIAAGSGTITPPPSVVVDQGNKREEIVVTNPGGGDNWDTGF